MNIEYFDPYGYAPFDRLKAGRAEVAGKNKKETPKQASGLNRHGSRPGGASPALRNVGNAKIPQRDNASLSHGAGIVKNKNGFPPSRE